jgi:hypothetical protein
MKTTFRFGLPRQMAGLLLLLCYLAVKLDRFIGYGSHKPTGQTLQWSRGRSHRSAQAMFPFQILLRALPPEVEAKLWKQVPRWPEGLQARVFAAAAWNLGKPIPLPQPASSRVHRLAAPNSTN